MAAGTAEPEGVNFQMVWKAAQDLGSDYVGWVNPRLQASDISLTGDWSEIFSCQITDVDDYDGDGIPDIVEIDNGTNPGMPMPMVMVFLMEKRS